MPKPGISAVHWNKVSKLSFLNKTLKRHNRESKVLNKAA